MLFGGATVACNTGIIQGLTALEAQNTGNAATHRLISDGGFIYLRNTGNPNLNQLIGLFRSVTGQTSTINTNVGPANLLTVTGVLPPGSPGCFPPPPPPPPGPSTTPPPRQDNTLLLLILLLSGGFGGGGRGGSSLQSLLPLLLLGGLGGGGAI